MGKCDETSVEVNMGDSASPMKPDNIFTFTVPPEAPVFRPTPEEFLDPLAYINKIRPIAEKSGLCKIKPPPNWQPPFAVDVDRLRFTPRIQRLNELEAITRVKLNFLDQIVKFWELQGSILKIPTVERKPLDLYSLHKIVKEAGGFEACSSERKWSKIASRMGHPQGKGVGSILKGHYERILYPYDVFKSTGATDIKLECEEVAPDAASAAGDVKPTRRWKKLNSEPESEHEGSQTEGALAGADNYKDKKTPTKQDSDTENKRALRESPTKRLLFHNAMQCSRPTRSSRALREHRQSNMTVSVAPAPPTVSPDDPLAKYICHNCARGDVEEQMLLCDGCDDSYHTFCLLPPLADVPKGDWRCPRCIAQEVSKPTEAFGFEQARREYTLTQFGEMADQFKSEYFNMPVHQMVPTATVEKEFWRIVSSIDEDVTVEYGADLHSMDHGSGFPTKASQSQYPVDQDYAESSWNLNNLPLLEGSVLGHINADISGMKIPWMYVGMCFATFCWHNEDHWSYSINYLHWGEPKTWYGVPGSKAEQFETTMRSAAPELFQWQPDLLHQLVTIMNPNILMSAGVPVYRTDQHAGEFVITFPRAYHAGFNQGYNFAEAVNFTPADWLKIGRECITHYSNLRRYCVFSHDELVCKMALEADNLGLTVALATYQDMRQMLSDERKLRKSLLEWGVTEAEREAYELLPDDARQCYLCKTTCFLSAVSCACTENIACLRHYTALCKCPPQKHRLRYRYTLDELPLMIEKLKEKSDAFREWADTVQNALDPDTPKTCDLDGLRAHLKRAHDLKMHKTDLVRALEMAIEDTEKCASVIHQLDLNKMRTRTRNRDTSADPKYRLTVEELTLFCEEIDGLACVLPEGSAVKEVLRQTADFECRAGALLRTELGTPASSGAAVARELDACVERGQQLCIQLPQLPPLVARQQQVKFLEEVRVLREDYDQLTLEVIARLLETGARVQPHYAVETQLAYLQTLKGQVEEWEKRARDALTPMSSLPARPPPEDPEEEEESQHMSLAELDALLNESDAIEAALPSQQQLSTAVSHAKDWLSKVEEMQSKESYPYYHTLEALVRKGQTIPLRLYEKDSLANALTSARQWKELTAKTFMRRSWPHSLMEALSPRTDILSPPTPSPRTPSRPAAPAGSPAPSCLEAGLFMQHFSEESSPTEIVAAFKAAEEKEMANMRELRAKNLRKDVRGPPQPGVTFCLCQKRQYGVMTQCELCKDWFHASCMSYRSSSPSPPPSPPATAEGADDGEGPPAPPPPLNLPFPNRDPKFMCPTCLRTKRPRLETILGLLVSLQRLPVRLAEGEALQCVTERAMAWQDAARTALGAREVAAAVARAQAKQRATSTQSDAHAAQFARERERQLTNELRKVTGRAGHESLMAAHSSRNPPASEHAYSASPRSPAPAEAGSFRARLPPHQVHRLEDLMMEGDLLEVNLDETAHVWNVLSAARGPRDPPSRLSVWSSASATAAAERAGAGAARMKRRAGNAAHRAPNHNKRQRQQLLPPVAAVAKVTTQRKRRGGAAPNERKLAGSQAPTTTNYLNRKQGVSSGSGLMMKKHYLARQERRRRGLVKAPKPFKATRGRRGGGASAGAPRMRRGAPRAGPGVPGVRSRSASASSRASSAEDDEDCAAHTCLRPTGKEVDWVQCDGGCDKWFHLHCVGLNKSSLKEDEDYYCVACKRKE